MCITVQQLKRVSYCDYDQDCRKQYDHEESDHIINKVQHHHVSGGRFYGNDSKKIDYEEDH